MLSKDILFGVLVSAFSGLVVTQEKDFCTKFHENKYSIDYSLFNIMVDRFLFIGQDYWLLEGKWPEGDTSKSLELELAKKSVKIDKFFSNKYITAFETGFCGIDGITEVCKRLTGLLRKKDSNYEIDWEPVDYDYNEAKLIISNDYTRKVVNTSRIDFPKGFEPNFSFEFIGHYVCFVHQRKDKDNYFRDYRCYSFDKDGNGVDQTYRLEYAIGHEMRKDSSLPKLEKYEGILSNINDSKKLVAIYPEFHLFHEDNKFTYCRSQSFFINLGCIKGEEKTKVLVDCSSNG